jgi:hypothetical protein
MSASPVRTTTRTVALDYGSFTLRGAGIDDAEDTTPLLDSILGSPGAVAATDGRELVVLSPHQNNFEMQLTIDVWDSEPPADADAWQQVVRSSIEVEGGRLLYESPTMEGAWFDVPTGTYSVLVSGRGFVAHGWPGSTTPGDVWRVQLWPGPVDGAVETLAVWVDPAESELTTPEALEAARTRMAEQEAEWLTNMNSIDLGEPLPTSITVAEPGHGPAMGFIGLPTPDMGLSGLDPAVRALLPTDRVPSPEEVEAAMAQVYGWHD